MDERRLDVAKDLGADRILKVTSDDPVKIAREVEAIMGEQPDVTIECAGADISTQTAVYVSGICDINLQKDLCKTATQK